MSISSFLRGSLDSAKKLVGIGDAPDQTKDGGSIGSDNHSRNGDLPSPVNECVKREVVVPPPDDNPGALVCGECGKQVEFSPELRRERIMRRGRLIIMMVFPGWSCSCGSIVTTDSVAEDLDEQIDDALADVGARPRFADGRRIIS